MSCIQLDTEVFLCSGGGGLLSPNSVLWEICALIAIERRNNRERRDLQVSLSSMVYLFTYSNNRCSHNNLTGALLWSTEKLQTSHVSGSFSFVAKIFLMADR